MLALEDIELKQTRFYQEIAEEERLEGRLEGIREGKLEGRLEGRKEESITLISRLLRRKFGLQPELEAALQRLPDMDLAALEDLAEVLLDFATIADLQNWLATQS